MRYAITSTDKALARLYIGGSCKAVSRAFCASVRYRDETPYAPTRAEILRLFNASGWRCIYCGCKCELGRSGAGVMTLDHVIPISRGGTSKLYNLVPSCGLCNERKDDSSLSDWLREINLPRDKFFERYWMLRRGVRFYSELATFIVDNTHS